MRPINYFGPNKNLLKKQETNLKSNPVSIYQKESSQLTSQTGNSTLPLPLPLPRPLFRFDLFISMNLFRSQLPLTNLC
jgi:hypothetical protein